MTDFETLVNVIGLPYKLYEAATVEVGESKIKEYVNVVVFEVEDRPIFFVFSVDGRLEKVL